jgi:hypothetical protein
LSVSPRGHHEQQNEQESIVKKQKGQERIMNKQHEKERFLDGDDTHLRVGGYGGTVHVEVVESVIKIRTTSPRRQETIGPDSPQLRAVAVRVAEGILAVPGPQVSEPVPTVSEEGHELLTPRLIWGSYLKGKLGTLPPGIMEWGRNELEEFYLSRDPRARKVMPSFDYAYGILTAARRLDRDGVLPFDCNLDRVEPGIITDYLQEAVVTGSSAHTMASYFRRFRTATRSFKKKWPRRWAKRYDPTEGVDRPSTKGIEPPEIGEERAEQLTVTLRAGKEWRALAAVKIARASGRRIGAIGARRQGTQLDAPPLCASDFMVSSDGKLLVTWRADAGKGGNYGRGDEVQVCPRELAVVYRWLRLHHPNPLGPGHPLIWDAEDPARGTAYDEISHAFERAWLATFGTPKPEGLLWHSLCRTTVTTIADEIGIEAAAQHTGRSDEVARRIYKRRRMNAQALTAAVLDRLREGQAR